MKNRLLEFTRVRGMRASPAATALLLISVLSAVNCAFAGLRIRLDRVGTVNGGENSTQFSSAVSTVSLNLNGMAHPNQFESYCIERSDYVPFDNREAVRFSLAAAGGYSNHPIADEPIGVHTDYLTFNSCRYGHTNDPVRMDPLYPSVSIPPEGLVVVPAPSSALIGALGLGLIGWLRRRSESSGLTA